MAVNLKTLLKKIEKKSGKQKAERKKKTMWKLIITFNIVESSPKKKEGLNWVYRGWTERKQR